MELNTGQVYLSDLAFVPEPTLAAWLALVPLLSLRQKPQPAD
jgi:hypothetical protein